MGTNPIAFHTRRDAPRRLRHAVLRLPRGSLAASPPPPEALRSGARGRRPRPPRAPRRQPTTWTLAPTQNSMLRGKPKATREEPTHGCKTEPCRFEWVTRIRALELMNSVCVFDTLRLVQRETKSKVSIFGTPCFDSHSNVKEQKGGCNHLWSRLFPTKLQLPSSDLGSPEAKDPTRNCPISASWTTVENSTAPLQAATCLFLVSKCRCTTRVGGGTGTYVLSRISVALLGG